MKTTIRLRNKSLLHAVVIMLFILGWGRPLLAQVSIGGQPYTFTNPVADTIPTVIMGSVDVAALLAEDAAEAERGKHVLPRFGYPFEVSIGLAKA